MGNLGNSHSWDEPSSKKVRQLHPFMFRYKAIRGDKLLEKWVENLVVPKAVKCPSRNSEVGSYTVLQHGLMHCLSTR
jgi:hypothetical protein